MRDHYRWIVWGLDCLERLGRLVLTPTAVMDRLKYRYDKWTGRRGTSCGGWGRMIRVQQSPCYSVLARCILSVWF